jgi:hypothetical protein
VHQREQGQRRPNSSKKDLTGRGVASTGNKGQPHHLNRHADEGRTTAYPRDGGADMEKGRTGGDRQPAKRRRRKLLRRAASEIAPETSCTREVEPQSDGREGAPPDPISGRLADGEKFRAAARAAAAA